MGVPSFFRWLARKYPKILVNVVEEYPKTLENVVRPDASQPNPNGVEFDCLYLDMNGIIHPCAHPENKEQPTSDEEIMLNIMAYIDRLFAIVRPRRLLYLAIDGVAPRAKMNQQRSRRFRAAREAKLKAQVEADVQADLRARGLLDGAVPPKPHWDSNQITPGTPFMALVADTLRYYVALRQSEDAGWAQVAVILSDASVPGEGEHKLMHYIRCQRAMPGYAPNTRHCICGLDADLIMLALATHEPHFAILREDVLQTNAKDQARDAHAPLEEQYKQQPFQFLFMNVYREYLAHDLRPPGAQPLPFAWDAERALDDFVFLCFFVGNDFLPHLPTLEIREGAIDLLVDAYKTRLGEMGGYVTENGRVELRRVAVLLRAIADLENDILARRRDKELREQQRDRDSKARGAAHLELVQQRAQQQQREQHEQAQAIERAMRHEQQQQQAQGSKDSANASAAERLRTLLAQATHTQRTLPTTQGPGPAQGQAPAQGPGQGDKAMSAQERIASEMKKRAEAAATAAEGADALRLGEEGWRARYYAAKFKVGMDNAEFFATLRQAYVEGLQWVLRYYYQGCASWAWYYPYHYAPFLKEIADVDALSVAFGPSAPFRPFEQLLSVLPPASAQFVPRAYAQLMCDATSPIADFYPEDFEVDLNGKKFEWQGVAVLPFIDEARLRAATAGLDATFTPEEQQRNSLGHELLFVRDDHALAPCLERAYTTRAETLLEGGELFGTVSAAPPSEYPGAHAELPSPLPSLPPLARHRVRCAVYRLPALPAGHEFKAALRPDVTMPAPVLSRGDLARQRSFEVGQAGNRLVRNTLGSEQPLPTNPHRGPHALGGAWTPYQRPVAAATHYDAQRSATRTAADLAPPAPAYAAPPPPYYGGGGYAAPAFGYTPTFGAVLPQYAPPPTYNGPSSRGRGGYERGGYERGGYAGRGGYDYNGRGDAYSSRGGGYAPRGGYDRGAYRGGGSQGYRGGNLY